MHREWIGGRVHTLLSHYWRHDDPVQLTAALGRDWADILEGMPQDVIQRACLDWMRSKRHRPAPADIYQLCLCLMPKPKPVAADEPARIDIWNLKPEEKAERKKQAEKIAGEFLKGRMLK